MSKVKEEAVAAVKATVSSGRRKSASVPKARKARSSRSPGARPPKKAKTSAVLAPNANIANESAAISEAQSHVVASKFGPDTALPKPAPRPTLPLSYGESHLLLLVRDPETLFVAWDMSPATLMALKSRLGSRAFAVSTLTLRLTRAGGGTSVIHVGRKARSRYIKIDGGPSYMAEIGFTLPTGRFELIARSAPCFVPLGAAARQESVETGRRAVLGYREARNLARVSLVPETPREAAKERPRASAPRDGVSPGATPRTTTPRTLGGASDLYRR